MKVFLNILKWLGLSNWTYLDNCKHHKVNGRLHRENGPAVIYVDGWKEFWFNREYIEDDGRAFCFEENKSA